jgi:acyl-CoA dehydrogenase
MRPSEYGLDPSYDTVWELARAVVATVPEAEREPGTLTREILKAFRDGGLPGYTVAEGGPDPVNLTVMREALMYGCSGLDAMFVLQATGGLLLAAGSDELRSEWLPRLASGEALAAMALTEPGAGSDLKAATTRVRADGGELVLDGLKSFISHAEVADVITVFAREESGYSLVAVPAGTPGLTVTPGPALIAPHDVATVTLDGVRLPATHRIGPPGSAFAQVLAALTVTRASVAGSAVGLAQAALDEAVRHCARREQFGRPLYKHGPVAGLLADSAADVESARLLAYRAAVLARDGAPGALDYASMAKLSASEAACRVVDRCVQAMGRFGLVAGSRIGDLYLLARPLRIYEGASEVLRLGVARALVAGSLGPEHVKAEE